MLQPEARHQAATTRLRKVRLARIVLVVLAIALLLAVTGCQRIGSDGEVETETARGSLSTARSALSTMAPDAQLLMIGTAEVTTPGSGVSWSYTFGSPKSGKLYTVLVTKNTLVHAVESGPAPLQQGEWPSVPGLDSWEIDSDEAYSRALKESGIRDEPAVYSMSMVTYVPESQRAKSPAKPLNWYVVFTPQAADAVRTTTVKVDAKTGAASTQP
jgi:hypothetical protein